MENYEYVDLKHHVSVMSNLIKLLGFTLVQLQFDVYNNNYNNNKNWRVLAAWNNRRG